MAFYGAPVSYDNHAEKACITALEMMKELRILRDKWVAEGLPFVDIGIGINTGEMAVGNMGSKQIFDYTVLGDHVNLGSRLEGLNKQYGTNIVISELTYKIVKDLFLVRELDLVKVKGKNEPVKIFELLAQKKEGHGYFSNGFMEKYSEGLRAYFAQEWDKAMDLFYKAHEIVPSDKCCKLYIDRTFAMKQNPPGPEWDGVTTMTTK
jgi:adenylate cyclase